MPVQTVFANLEAGLSVNEITETFEISSEEVRAVINFVTRSLDKEPSHAPTITQEGPH